MNIIQEFEVSEDGQHPFRIAETQRSVKLTYIKNIFSLFPQDLLGKTSYIRCILRLTKTNERQSTGVVSPTPQRTATALKSLCLTASVNNAIESEGFVNNAIIKL